MYGIVPTSFFCSDVEIEGTGPVWGGGFADIWKGRSSQSMTHVSGSSVCLKVLRFFTAGNSRQDLLKAFCQEALVWKQLRHPNILPFLGVSKDLFRPSYCLISPWMENGNIVAFLDRNPSLDSTFRLKSVIDVARGIQYLHDFDPPIVHADIRGGNILVNQDLCCVLADFGISLMVETQVPGSTTLSRGSTRWLPPEMMDQSLFHPFYITARDIYSFGCTIIEIYTGRPPFPHLKSDASVIHEVLHKRSGHPRPPVDSFPSDRLWQLVLDCLLITPGDRPSATSLLQSLASSESSNHVPLASNRSVFPTIISAQGSPSQVVEPNKGHKGTIAAPPKILRSKLNKERKRKRASQELSSSRAVDNEYLYRAPKRIRQGDVPNTSTTIRDRMKNVFDQCYQTVHDCLAFDGRPRRTLFMTLPDKKEHPDYYDLVEYPISMQQIHENSCGSYYQTVQQYRDDWKLMFDNARTYRHKNTRMYDDAGELEKVFDQAFEKAIKESGLPGLWMRMSPPPE
ncbi:kinase-like domain-containing protein [Mucidula mucida]|nr:kinase-like domain-containing protein [Mucidula mucida]